MCLRDSQVIHRRLFGDLYHVKTHQWRFTGGQANWLRKFLCVRLFACLGGLFDGKPSLAVSQAVKEITKEVSENEEKVDEDDIPDLTLKRITWS